MKENSHEKLVWLVRFYGMSTSVGYLMPKPVYKYSHMSKWFQVFLFDIS